MIHPLAWYKILSVTAHRIVNVNPVQAYFMWFLGLSIRFRYEVQEYIEKNYPEYP